MLIYCPKSGTKAILINYRRRKALAGAWIYKFRKLSWQKCNGILNKRTKETVQSERFGIKCIVVKGYIVELNKWDRESITALHFLYVFSQWSVINAYPYSVITIWASKKYLYSDYYLEVCNFCERHAGHLKGLTTSSFWMGYNEYPKKFLVHSVRIKNARNMRS